MTTTASSPCHRPRGFTLIELLVVISIIAMLIAILLPALQAARKTAQEAVCATRIRGFQQGMAVFAQDNGGWYPGVNSNGLTVSQAEINASGSYAASAGASNGARQAIMLSRRFITPEFAISPSDQNKRPWDPNSGSGIETENISFSMLAIASTNPLGGGLNVLASTSAHRGRAAEWRDTFNARAIMMSDRPLSPTRTEGSLDENTGDTYSIHTEYTGQPNWRGHVVYNDNHVQFLPSLVASGTQNSDGPVIGHDNIFQFANRQTTDMQLPGGWTQADAVPYDTGMTFMGPNQRFSAAGD